MKLVFWVALAWFLKASLEYQKNFKNFLFKMPGVQLHYIVYIISKSVTLDSSPLAIVVGFTF